MSGDPGGGVPRAGAPGARLLPGAPAGGSPPAWTLTVVTDDAAATRDLAGALAPLSLPGDVVLLVGGLGAGKTTFAQGFARGLGVAGPVTSPTFTLVRQYPVARDTRGVRQLLHADMYRVETLAEIVDLGLPELVEDGAVALVEWGDVAAPVLAEATLTVTLERAGGPQHGDDEPRRVVIAGRGPGWAERRTSVAAAVDGVIPGPP